MAQETRVEELETKVARLKTKARPKCLAADVHWLKCDGALNVIERQMRLMEVMCDLEAAEQRQAEAEAAKRAQKPARAVASRDDVPALPAKPSPPPTQPSEAPAPMPDQPRRRDRPTARSGR